MKGKLATPVVRECDHCTESFETVSPIQRFCKPRCKHAFAARLRVQRNAEKTERRCYRCQETKPASEFSALSHSYCRPCANEYQRSKTATLTPEQRAKRAVRRRREYERVGREVTRITVRRWRWNLTEQDLQAMLVNQGGRCAICPAREPGGRGTWHVDHDHTCCSKGRSCGACIRGLLCSNCNVLLGHAKDDTAILQAAITYLRLPRQPRLHAV